MGEQQCHIDISHVKIRFECVDEIVIPNSLKITKYSNFIIIRSNQYVFTIFEKNKKVNVCGIKTLQKIPIALKYFFRIFKTTCKNVIIDNITGTGNLQKEIPLHKILKNQSEEIYITFRPNIFSAAIIRTRTPFIGGTILLFQNGKFNIVGCKSIKEIKTTLNRFYNYIDTHKIKNVD